MLLNNHKQCHNCRHHLINQGEFSDNGIVSHVRFFDEDVILHLGR